MHRTNEAQFKIVTSCSKAHQGVWGWNIQLAIASNNNTSSNNNNNNNNYVSVNSLATNFRFERVTREQT